MMGSGDDDDDYGWFDVEGDEPNVEDTTVSAEEGFAASRPMAHQPQPDLVTRSFQSQNTLCVWSWGVAGLRIVQERQGVAHAEFRIFAKLDEREWVVWRRIDRVVKLVADGKRAGAWSNSAQVSWERLSRSLAARSNQRDSRYLKSVCALLQDFLLQYLFASNDLAPLVSFVSSTVTHHHHGDDQQVQTGTLPQGRVSTSTSTRAHSSRSA